MRIRMGAALLVALFFLCLRVGFGEAPLCVAQDGCAALLTEAGEEIVPLGQYADLIDLGGEGDAWRCAAGVRTDAGILYGLMDATGALRTSCAYSSIRRAGTVFLIAAEDRMGAINAQGEVVLPMEYTQLVAFDEAHFLALRSDPYDAEPDEIYAVNARAETRSATGCRAENGLNPVKSGRMLWQDADTERYGYMNAEGESVIAADYPQARPFQGDWAEALQDGLWGVLNTDGSWNIEPRYAWIERLQGGAVAIGLLPEGGFELRSLAEDGGETLVFPQEFSADIVNDKVVLRSAEETRILLPDGQLLWSGAANAQVFAGCGDSLLLMDGQWGDSCAALLYADGRLSAARWQWLVPLDGAHYAQVQMEATRYYSYHLKRDKNKINYRSFRYGVIDAQGGEVLPCAYDSVALVVENRYLLTLGETLLLANEQGEILWSREAP